VPDQKTNLSFFHQRLDPLGVTDENNKIKLWQNDINNKDSHEDILVDVPVFRELPEGIEIAVYTLDRLQITYSREGTKAKKKFSIIRLEKPIVRANGDLMKYKLPKGAGTHPFFPPALVDKYDRKEPIETLYMVEGYFKAWKACMHGCDIIGLSSITHMKDTETGKLHSDIVKLINTCGVKKVVWLTDGDAIDITQKELKEGLDLSKRPRGFFASVSTFKTLFDDYEDLEKWFFHIDTDNILLNNKNILREDVKGIDDLLITLAAKEKDIIADLLSLQSGQYFQKFNITYSTGKAYTHFHLRDVKDFYLFHVERRPELKDKEFIFSGTRYQYNEETGDCDVKIPGAAKLYFRVGDDYFKFVNIPNQYQQLERAFHSRKKGTISDDHGRNFVKYIPKYEAFCNVPNHFNFEQIIHNCFNVYSPLDFIPDEDKCTEEDCPVIMNFIRHLFGEKTVSYTDPEKEKHEYQTMELALDYLQLLYQQPQQKLPIVCLVSRENNTGKSTFANFLRMMLGANTAIVGNADLQSDFNAHWATKSVVVCDETKIDKQQVVEKIKNLSTARKIFMNAKGRGQVELDCFIKFVLITNNEDSFIHATDDDIRYWVIKVPVLTQENPTILDQIKEEMPFFLSFLQHRKLATKLENRMWFHPKLLKTEALNKVIAYSQPQVEKELRHYLKEMFLDTGVDEIKMTTDEVHKEVFKLSSRYERYYLARIIKENLKCDTYHEWKVDGLDKKYKTEGEAIAAAEVKFPDVEGYMLQGKIKRYHTVTRYSYPKFEEKYDAEKRKTETLRVEVNSHGRPFIFHRKDFVSAEDQVINDPEDLFINQMTGNGQADDLPFPIN
jgi:hypothetical protein